VANPGVVQGVLNKLRVSINWANFQALAVTPSFLGRDMVTLDFQGESTSFIETAAGVIQSPQPYVMTQLAIHLLKTQGLAALYERQWRANANLGTGTVRGDAAATGPWELQNCAILSVGQLTFAGTTADYLVNIKGYYALNSDLWP
jgi:hypothetical protein